MVEFCEWCLVFLFKYYLMFYDINEMGCIIFIWGGVVSILNNNKINYSDLG